MQWLRQSANLSSLLKHLIFFPFKGKRSRWEKRTMACFLAQRNLTLVTSSELYYETVRINVCDKQFPLCAQAAWNVYFQFFSLSSCCSFIIFGWPRQSVNLSECPKHLILFSVNALISWVGWKTYKTQWEGARWPDILVTSFKPSIECAWTSVIYLFLRAHT